MLWVSTLRDRTPLPLCQMRPSVSSTPRLSMYRSVSMVVYRSGQLDFAIAIAFGQNAIVNLLGLVGHLATGLLFARRRVVIPRARRLIESLKGTPCKPHDGLIWLICARWNILWANVYSIVIGTLNTQGSP